MTPNSWNTNLARAGKNSLFDAVKFLKRPLDWRMGFG